MNTCRFCKRTSYEHGAGELVRYGVRHYAHGPCLYRARGLASIVRLPRWMIEQLPVFLMQREGVHLEEVLSHRVMVGNDGPLSDQQTAAVVRAVEAEHARVQSLENEIFQEITES